MLELEWPTINKTKDGQPNDVAYVSGELFGVGWKATPDNPRGNRSKSYELRCKGKGEWNTYDIVAVDGTVKLSINGKFVNGISKAEIKKGYICLESEGAEIHFRNIRIMELPSGRATPYRSASIRCAASTPLRMAPLPSKCARGWSFFGSPRRNLYIPFRMPSRTPSGIGSMSYCSFINVM